VECVGCSACPTGPSPDCLPFEHDSRTYYRCTEPAEWADARTTCEDAGLQLARVNDQAENDALEGVATEDTWLGANDITTEGSWRWTDGTAFWMGTTTGTPVSGRYENWSTVEAGQPDNLQYNGASNADCGIIDSSGAWADRSCTAVHAYLCEP
jgi:hypothetical protein